MKLNNLLIILLLRISLGWLLLYTGFEKLSEGFSAKGYLMSLHGNFSGIFVPLAGNPIVDNLVIWGEILIGACLILGFLVRFASFWGIIMMLLFYFSGFPYEHSLIIEEHIIYILVLVLLITSKAGDYYGLDKILEKKLPKLKNLMG